MRSARQTAVFGGSGGRIAQLLRLEGPRAALSPCQSEARASPWSWKSPLACDVRLPGPTWNVCLRGVHVPSCAGGRYPASSGPGLSMSVSISTSVRTLCSMNGPAELAGALPPASPPASACGPLRSPPRLAPLWALSTCRSRVLSGSLVASASWPRSSGPSRLSACLGTCHTFSL